MALEDLTGVSKFIDDYVNTNPAAGDNVSEGDDHLRGIKNVLLNTFPNVDAAVNPTPAEFNRSVGVTEDIQPALDNANTALASVKALQKRLWTTVSNNVTDADHDIDFSAGIQMDSVGDEPIEVLTTLVKRIDANWVAGTNQGGFPSALTLSADTFYHFFVIKDVTNDLVDAGFDTSLTATNLLADATDYTKYWRVGFMSTDASSNWDTFIQSGRLFTLGTKVDDIVNTVPPVTPTLTTLTLPTGLKIEADVNVALKVVGNFVSAGGTSYGYLQVSDGNLSAGQNATSNDLVANTVTVSVTESTGNQDTNTGSARILVPTNTSAQVYVDYNEDIAPGVSNTFTEEYSLTLNGWRDNPL